MPPLTAIERFFERLFERPSARLFRARIQPVQLQRRIERAMEGERLTTSDRTLVPNRFVVHLHPTDLAEFGDMTGTPRLRAGRRSAVLRAGASLYRRRPAAGRPPGRPDHRADGHPRRCAVRGGDRRPWRPRTGGRHADRRAGDRRARSDRDPRLRHPEAAQPAGDPAGHRSGRPDPRGRRRGRQPDHRPGDRQRLRRARWAGLAPSRPDRRSTRDAGLRGSRQHERIARQRRDASAQVVLGCR